MIGFKTKLAFLSLGVLIVDQWAKYLAEQYLFGNAPVVIVPGFVDLSYVSNSGIAFGLFAAGSSVAGVAIITALGLLALALVLYYFVNTPETNRVALVALALILGGAVGNLLDRVLSGTVTDFIDVYIGTHHWPTFNAADSAITIGIILIAFDALWLQREADPAS